MYSLIKDMNLGTKVLLVAAFSSVIALSLFLSQVVFAGVGVSVTPSFPSTVAVGDTNVAVTLDITNNSNDGDGNPLTLDSIKLIPSCGAIGVGCTTLDPGVFSVDPSGTGAGSCAANTFTIAETDGASGEVTFTPNASIALTPGQTCTINFTVDVLGVPDTDATGAEGLQTLQLGNVTGTDQLEQPGTGSGSDTTTVGKASPGIQTTPSAGGPIGTVLNDTATLTGGSSPTGDVVFTLYPPSDATCEATPVYTDTDTTAPYTTDDGGYTSLVAGVYHWKAAYAGDVNNDAVTSPCSEEAVTVTLASPGIQTTPSAGGPIGTVLNDTATLTGGSSPTGNVTFKLFDPSDTTCAGPEVFSQVDGVAPYTTGPGYTSLVAGTYRWTADYAGDANNNPVSSGCQDEQVTIGKASPGIQTTPSAGGPIGTVLNDTATLTGGSSPTGDVVFTLYPPSDATCEATPVYTDTDTTAPYTTDDGGYTSLVAGVYHWKAAYAGDVNNDAVTSPCSEEAVTVTQPAGEWCSPGYWRNHIDSWVGFRTDDLFLASYPGFVFPTAKKNAKFAPKASPTLLDILQNPQIYGGEAFNLVGDLLSEAHPDVNFEKGDDRIENCPLN